MEGAGKIRLEDLKEGNEIKGNSKGKTTREREYI